DPRRRRPRRTALLHVDGRGVHWPRRWRWRRQLRDPGRSALRARVGRLAPSTNTVMLGKGGRNGTGSPPPATCPQADAGPLGFRDLRRDNDFWGTMIDIARGRRITGELLTPRGGSGGGGGGDTGPRCAPNPSFANDQKGGGGGAGGGILIVKALGRIVIKSTGLIDANGGNGGGGEQAGTNSHAGGGGGGSGGMIVLMSGTGIHITRHGRPYAEAVTSNNTNGAYTFAIQADGG